MARKSNAQIREEERQRQADIEARAGEMVQAMVPDLIAKISAQLLAKRGELGADVPPPSQDDHNWAASLAAAIVKAGDPKGVKRAVDPVIAAQRARARDEMVRTLVDLRARGAVPLYKITTTMWLNDTLVQPQWRDDGTKKFNDTVIKWLMPPNQGMVPQNDEARQVHTLYLKSIGSIEAEGLPLAPWMDPRAPWVWSKDGIVQGRPITEPPPLPDQGAPLFDDPRLPGQSSAPERREIAVLGTAAPRVVDTTNTLGG